MWVCFLFDCVMECVGYGCIGGGVICEGGDMDDFVVVIVVREMVVVFGVGEGEVVGMEVLDGVFGGIG